MPLKLLPRIGRLHSESFVSGLGDVLRPCKCLHLIMLTEPNCVKTAVASGSSSFGLCCCYLAHHAARMEQHRLLRRSCGLPQLGFSGQHLADGKEFFGMIIAALW